MRLIAIITLLSLLAYPTHAEEGGTDLPSLAAGVIDTIQTETLGLHRQANVETITIFSPTDSTHHYANGVVMTAFKDVLYCMWQSSPTDEDSPETCVMYSKSRTEPELTNIPDARVKQSAGNLTDGTPFMVGCFTGNKRRFPLVLLQSSDGICFNKAALLRSGGDDPPQQRYEGKAKTLGYSYPKSIDYHRRLYITYSTNKEIVEVTIFNY